MVYPLDMYTWSAEGYYIPSKFKVDGVVYEGTWDNSGRIRLNLPAGRHTIEMVKEKYIFEKWTSGTDGWCEVTFDNPLANPTVATICDPAGFIVCYVHPGEAKFTDPVLTPKEIGTDYAKIDVSTKNVGNIAGSATIWVLVVEWGIEVERFTTPIVNPGDSYTKEVLIKGLNPNTIYNICAGFP